MGTEAVQYPAHWHRGPFGVVPKTGYKSRVVPLARSVHLFRVSHGTEKEHPTMTVFAAAALAALVTLTVAACGNPTYADGTRVSRGRRTPWQDVAALFGRVYPWEAPQWKPWPKG